MQTWSVRPLWAVSTITLCGVGGLMGNQDDPSKRQWRRLEMREIDRLTEQCPTAFGPDEEARGIQRSGSCDGGTYQARRHACNRPLDRRRGLRSYAGLMRATTGPGQTQGSWQVLASKLVRPPLVHRIWPIAWRRSATESNPSSSPSPLMAFACISPTPQS